MIPVQYKTPLSDQQTNTEMNLYDTAYDMTLYMTMNPLDIPVTVKFSETNVTEIDRSYMYYGLGGILVCLVVCMICYNFYIYMKEALGRQEAALRETNERLARLSHRRPPMNPGRIFIEDFHEVHPNSLRQRITEHVHVTNAGHGNAAVETGEMKEIRRINDMTVPLRATEEIFERRYFPEDFQDLLSQNSLRQETERSRPVLCETEKCDSVVIDLSWMSEQPLAYSTPQVSNEIIHNTKGGSADFSRKDIKVGESLEDPTPKDIYHTPSKIHSTKSPFSPEGQTRSSPPTPEITRRRFATPRKDSPRRPSSWR